MDYLATIEQFATNAGCQIAYRNGQEGILKIDNPMDGIHNLIIGVAPPILIMEQFLFSFRADNGQMFKQLLQKNRDMIHGAFVINEEGNKVLFRYTMQLENLDFNEFESALNSLGLLLSEYYQQIIDFSKI
ncbi:MAG: YbjN domain-containing protein [Candidatus Pseudobacter hemicellulosilyticus]|uniref:YbjN domain-containing protein n=1 Tax=Candidatus Pseudobacter hemicellulosilyticus TaxID=3121375 RepID=A0AAJ6BFC3_9BACT|nr:MAG: YbjN domain-containing protein [Pseudobacter sp.]